MAGAFSTHLTNSYYTGNQRSHPFVQNSDESQISIHGPMSFNRHMHGTIFPSQANFSMMDNSSASMLSDISEESAVKFAALQAKLNKQLGPEYISTRPGPGGGPKLTYAEGWKIINLANEVFGFNGWSTSVVSLTTDFMDFNEESRRYSIGVTAIIRVTLRDGVFHEDIGYGMLENSKSKGMALDKCKKEAVTDGVKRALRNFGNLLGNCLYDKHFTQEIAKVKAQPPQFNKDGLHRRPEFEENKTNINNDSSTASTTNTKSIFASSSKSSTSSSAACQSFKTEQDADIYNHGRPNSVLPTHIKPTSTANRMPPPDIRPNLNASKNAQTSINNVATSSDNQPQQPQQSRGPSAPKSVVNSRLLSNPPPLPDTDIDDAYHFPSEDDPFLAALDFAELEADLGRPIDYDGGLTTDQGRMRTHTSENSSSRGDGVDRQVHEQPAPVEPMETIKRSKPHKVQQSSTSRQASTITSDQSLAQDQVHNSRGQQIVNGGGPEAQQQQNASSNFSTGGLNPLRGLNPQRHQSSSGAAQSTNAGAQRWNGAGGLKRTADAMQPPGVRRGMGLSDALNASTSNSSTRREPLMSLYDSTAPGGPDAKRMKF